MWKIQTFVHSENDVDYVGDIEMWDQHKRSKHTIKRLFTRQDSQPLPGLILPESEVKRQEQDNEE